MKKFEKGLEIVANVALMLSGALGLVLISKGKDSGVFDNPLV